MTKRLFLPLLIGLAVIASACNIHDPVGGSNAGCEYSSNHYTALDTHQVVEDAGDYVGARFAAAVDSQDCGTVTICVDYSDAATGNGSSCETGAVSSGLDAVAVKVDGVGAIVALDSRFSQGGLTCEYHDPNGSNPSGCPASVPVDG